MGAWINQVFEAGQANKFGIVRRAVHSVDQFASEKELVAEIKKRGFHLVRSQGQYIIFCHKGDFQIIC